MLAIQQEKGMEIEADSSVTVWYDFQDSFAGVFRTAGYCAVQHLPGMIF